ncbi:MAG: hypothetical protein JXX29_22835 [Deltaproteobacteria bacterium]|nr:hypothetical protein [Deltaproteobacteria bacterium]MBN2674535.1 hypothetical protein [Deltaproteobacteria bacterium]
MRSNIHFRLCILFVGVFLIMGCSDDVPQDNASDGGTTDGDADSDADGDADNDNDSDADGDSDSDADGDTSSGWYSDECVVTTCQGHIYQCGDCLDNDGDGNIDSRDTNCLGPCDNNESGYNMEIPGGNNQPCMQECYYDQDGGSGNDDCHWDHRCDPLQPEEVSGCAYLGGCPACDCDGWLDFQSQACLDFCGPLTPNGCDCFGCCQLGGTDEWRFLGTPGCSVDNIESCDLCTPVGSCLNDCGRCELCLGKTTIPDDCFTGWDTDIDSDPTNDDTDTPDYRCAANVQPCGLESDLPCPNGQYCITGCCQGTVAE